MFLWRSSECLGKVYVGAAEENCCMCSLPPLSGWPQSCLSPPYCYRSPQLGHVSFLGHSGLAPQGEETKKEEGGKGESINKITCVSPWSGWLPVFVFLYADLNARKFMNVTPSLGFTCLQLMVWSLLGSAALWVTSYQQLTIKYIS